MTKILGIDPGSQFCGYGIIHVKGQKQSCEDYGVIEIPTRWSFPKKLNYLADSLEGIYLKHQPHYTSVEKIFLGKNADSAFKLGHVRGICLQLASKHETQVDEIAARSVKKIVTGSGAATKDHVRCIVTQQLNLSLNTRYDASDALALAISCAQRLWLQTLESKMESTR